MAPFRIALALERAILRNQARTVLERRAGVQVSVASPTAAGVLGRVDLTSVDLIVAEASVGDLADLVKARATVNPRPHLTVITGDDPGTVATRLGLQRHNIVRAPGDDQGFTALLNGLVDNRNPGPLTPRPALPQLTTTGTTAPGPAGGAGYRRRDLLLIGCSTGGPEALTKVLSALPGTFPAPILVCQHMPPNFTEMLAERLDRVTSLKVAVPTGPTKPKPGEVWIAPGGRHMVVTSATKEIGLDDGPAEHSVRPAVDVLFRSAAEHFGRSSVAVILTGMGSDGKLGVERLHRQGTHVIVQDEASSVVWGMPGAVANAGLADQVLPIDRIGPAILDAFRLPSGALAPAAKPATLTAGGRS